MTTLTRTLFCTPWGGTLFYLWLRARWSVGVIAGMSLVGYIMQAIWPHAEWLTGVGALGVSTVMFAAAHLVGVFTHGGGDLGSVDSTFPRYLLVLPAKTRTLVLIPMTVGMGTMAAIWWLTAKLFADRMLITTVDVHAPLWPAALLAAVLAWLQAASWSPFWFPYLRVGVAMGVPGGLVAFGIIAAFRGVPAPVIAAIYIITIVIAYKAAVEGLARTRRGETAAANWIGRGRLAAITRTASPFPSPMAAQIWFEVRRNILLVPALSIGIALMLVFVNVLAARRAGSLLLADFEVQPVLLMLVLMIGMPIFAAGMHGPAMGKTDAWSTPVLISSFIATRPLTTAQIVFSKMIAATVATFVSWAGVVVVILGWSLFPNAMGPGHSLSGWAAERLNWPVGIAAVCALLLLMAATWKQMAQSMFITLLGRKWLAVTITFASVGGFVVLSTVAGLVARDPRLRHAFPALVPWLIGGLLAVRIIAGGWCLRRSVERRVMSPRQAMAIIYCWLVGVAVYFLLLALTIPESAKPGILIMVGIAALLPPGARVLAAFPALDANRHR